MTKLSFFRFLTTGSKRFFADYEPITVVFGVFFRFGLAAHF